MVILDYTPPVGKARAGGVPVAGTPADWRRAGLIGPTHPALRRRGRYLCVQFGALTLCEPVSHFSGGARW